MPKVKYAWNADRNGKKVGIKRISSDDIITHAHNLNPSSSPDKGASIRIHGNGNYVVASKYEAGNRLPKKRIASGRFIRDSINESVPVWIDAHRMSPVQFASVIRTVEDIITVDKDVSIELVERDGRSMVLARKKK